MQPVTPVLPSHPSAEEVTFAKDQPEYLPLPAIRSAWAGGRVTTRWKLSFQERLKLLFNGSLYLQVLTFRERLQPVMLSVDEPDLEDCGVDYAEVLAL